MVLSRTRGFSLVEAIVVIALFTVLLMAITYSVAQIYKLNSATLEQANEIEFARRGLFTWIRDAREMTLGANGAFPLVRAENHRVGFYSDIDKDQSVEYVEYVLATTTIRKFTYEATGTPAVYATTTPARVDILSEYIQNIPQGQTTFRYYNDAGTLIANPQAQISDIRYIRMNVIVNIDPARSPGEFMLQGSAVPRNLKENL
jgi:prepilin-type N-terminal cleavage/methylation domain-containing protein